MISSINKNSSGQHISDLVIVGLYGRHDVDDAERKLVGLGLESDIVLYRPSAINAYKRAVASVVRASSIDDRKWTVAKVKADAEEIIHQFVGKQLVDSYETGLTDKAVRFSHEVATRFNSRAYREGTVEGEELVMASDVSHPIAQELIAEFRRLHLETSGSDLMRASVDAFNRRAGVRLRTNGGVWLFSAEQSNFVRRWASWAENYGQAVVIPVYDDQESRAVIQRSAEDSVAAGLEELLEDLEKFQKESTRLSTLEKRVEKLDELRDKVSTYERVLSISMDGLRRGIADAETAFVDAIGKIEAEKENQK